MPPPNTPEEGLPDEQAPSATLRAESPATSCPFNYQTLEYVDQVDQELICPICREPFISPVTTSCDHTFCHSCLLHAWSLSNTCPTDRKPINFGVDTSPAAKIVHNQLGNLRVRCPNSITGCQLILCRSDAEDHVDRHCPYTLVQCPVRGCDKKITRAGSELKECLHQATPCKYCGKQVEKVDMQSHINHDCPKSHQSCPHCGLKFPRSVLEQHASRCDEAVVPCKHTSVGCVIKIRRKEAEDHEHGCPYALLEKLGAIVVEQRDRIAELERRDRERERRLKSLEFQVMQSSYSDYPRPIRTTNSTTADAMVDGLSPLADDAFRGVGSSSGVSPPYESRDQYLLALFESVDARMEMLQKNMSDLEGRQTVMLLNETMPVKEQLAEMRSQLGVQGMHVRWLMNFRLQERSRHISGAVNAGMGGVAAASGAGSGDHSENDARGGGRRLSDALRENPPRL